MNQLLVKHGKLSLEEEPTPVANDDEVLVRVEYSLVSTGTELSSVKKRQSAFLEVLRDKKLVERFKKLVSQRGFLQALQIAKTKINEPSLLGYSNSGIVVQVGRNVSHVKLGDRVACAGAGYAVHANYAVIPKNLVVKIPQGVLTSQACFAGVGAIALQAVRRADAKIGDKAVVYGLGLVGLLASRILQLNGVEVIGVDISAQKLSKAKKLGINAVTPNQLGKEVANFSNNNGADYVLLTAASPSSELANNAIKLCRRKGKLIIVGDVGLNLDREALYKRELDVLISTSYGPGRYDQQYEEKGVDYPYAYVRWTEQRNLQAFVELLSKGLQVESLVDKICEPQYVLKSFSELQRGKINVLVIKYPLVEKTHHLELKPAFHSSRASLCLIGPGNFAKSTLISAIAKSGISITSVASMTPSNARYVAELCKSNKCYSNYEDALADKSTNTVAITTRHSTHADLVVKALEQGKHVFVEKPLALNDSQLNKIEHALKKHSKVLVVGHNRRYSPVLQKVKEFIGNRPVVVNYRVKADSLSLDHFLNDLNEGGRIIGEMVHFFDVFLYLCDSQITSVSASTIDFQNVAVAIVFENGSLCNLLYTTSGSDKTEKEKIEVLFGNTTIELTDFHNVIANTNGKREVLYSGKQNKGHNEEMQFFARAIQGQVDPLPNLNAAFTATRIAFRVSNQLHGI